MIRVGTSQLLQEGLGVFADQDIDARICLGHYTGEILDDDEFEKRFPQKVLDAWNQDPDVQRFKVEKKLWNKKQLKVKPLPCKPLIFPHKRTGAYVLWIQRMKKYIDAEDESKSNWTRYINHKKGRKANVKFNHDASITTLRPIAKDEELFIDYGEEFFEHFHFIPE